MTLTPWHVRDVRFGKARHGEVGYEDHEVDVFLRQIEATLAGHGGLTAEDVQAVRFTERRHRGYSAPAVDVFLDEVAATLAEPTVSAEISGLDASAEKEQSPSLWASTPVTSVSLLASAQFAARDGLAADLPAPIEGEPAFDADEVDAYLDRINATLAGWDTLNGHDLLTATFNPPPPGRPGYNRSGVQAFLVVAAISLRKLGSGTDKANTQPTRLPSPSTATPPPSAPARQRLPTRPSPGRRSPMAPWGAVPLHEPTASVRPDPGSSRTDGQRPGARPTPYDKDEVHAFLDRIRATLAGQDAVSAQDVLAVEFNPPPPGQSGHSETEFLALVAELLEQPDRRADRVQPASYPSAFAPLTPEEIHDLRLNPAAPADRGYAEAEVDTLLDRVEATLAGEDTLTAQDVRDIRFHELPPGAGGYDRSEVDALLDLVEGHLTDGLVHPHPA